MLQYILLYFHSIILLFSVSLVWILLLSASRPLQSKARVVVKEFSFLDGPLPTVIFLIIVNLFHLGVKFFSLSAR